MSYIINIKINHEDTNRLQENINFLKEELAQKDQEIKKLKNMIEKSSHHKLIERSKTSSTIKEKEKDIKTILLNILKKN